MMSIESPTALAVAQDKYESQKEYVNVKQAQVDLAVTELANTQAFLAVANLKEQLNELNNTLCQYEGDCKTLVLAEFEKLKGTDAETKKFGRFGVRESTKVIYIEQDALDWAKEKNLEEELVISKLDSKKFENLVKYLRPDFVVIEKVPSVTISQK